MRHGKGGKGGSFGKAGGGATGLKSKLVQSPMAPAMTPKGGGKSMKGK